MAALTNKTGVVTRTNATGLQLDGAEWFSISRYADPQPELPAEGQRVRLGLDGKNFCRTIESAGPALHVVDAAHEAPAQREPEGRGPMTVGTTSRETVITRLACIKAAAEFLSTRPDAKSPDVLAVAAAWEAWAVRS